MFHQAKADMNFFATAHGKGENNGVGGDVKNVVWRKALQQKEVVASCEESVSVAKKKFPDFCDCFLPKKIYQIFIHVYQSEISAALQANGRNNVCSS